MKSAIPEQIWSGGQTGADQGGLYAAEEAGIKTNGWMPRGFLTEAGRDPGLAKRFELREHHDANYPARTITNVFQTDATIVFGNPHSPGTRLTLKQCIRNSKPYITVEFPPAADQDKIISDVEYFLQQHKPRRLNIAGNRESNAPGIQSFVQTILRNVISEIRAKEEKEK